MRILLAAIVALLCWPAAASAAPWAELPFEPLAGDRAATCLQAVGGDRVALVRTADDGGEELALQRVAVDGTLVPDGTVPLGVSFRVPDDLAPCPAVAVAPSGAAVVAAVPFARRGRGLGIAARDAGGAFGPPQRIPVPRGTSADSARAAVASNGAGIVIWVEDRDGVERLRAVRRAAGGAFGAPVTLEERLEEALPSSPVVGIDETGSATVAWVSAGRRRAIQAATAPAGGPFGAPQRLSRAHPDSLAVAVAADGGALLAFDADCLVCVFERAPGAMRLTPVPVSANGGTYPDVALAPGGGAVVAWRQGERTPMKVDVALRPPGGAFLLRQVLDRRAPGVDRWAQFGPLPRFREAGPPDAAVGADGTVAVAWLEGPPLVGGNEPVRVALAAGTLAGGWEGTTLLGGPARSADGLAVLAAPAAVLWTDNLLATVFGFQEPDRSGRLHRALPGVAPGPEPPPPAVRLSARRQRIRAGQPVIVRARCSAACDLRGVSRRAHGAGTAELDGPGTVRIALYPVAGRSFLTGRRRPLRVTVHATPPGGRRETVARIAVRVRKE